MKRVLIHQTRFDSALGGVDFLPLMLIAELQRRNCDVTLALNWASDIAEASRMSGIPIDTGKLKVEIVKPRRNFPARLDATLPFYRTWRLKALAKHADICISTVNMMDFGKPAHHFVFLLRHFGDNAFFDHVTHRPPRTGAAAAYRKLRTALAESILRPLLGVRSTRKILADPREHIYPNSRYAEKVMREFYGAFNSTVFYPPTIFEPSAVQSGADPLRVIYLGRLFPEKRVAAIVRIVERARELSGMELTLHIGGRLDPLPCVEALKRSAAEKPWIRLLGALYGGEKERFLLSGTYAIHAERDESFGIAVTEYLKAGLIVIVPDEGGSCEIVNSPALTYRTDDEAVRILAGLLTDAGFRETQRRRCRERAEVFSRQAYAKRQSELLSAILDETNPEP